MNGKTIPILACVAIAMVAGADRTLAQTPVIWLVKSLSQ